MSNLNNMSRWILLQLEEKYAGHKSTDVSRLSDYCRLYRVERGEVESTVLDPDAIQEYDLESPNFLAERGLLGSTEFERRYSFVIKTVFSFLRLHIPLFRQYGGATVMLTVYELLSALSQHRKTTVKTHMTILGEQYKHPQVEDYAEYYRYVGGFLATTKILQRLRHNLQRLLDDGLCRKTDTLLTLLTPYFVKGGEEYIEEYDV